MRGLLEWRCLLERRKRLGVLFSEIVIFGDGKKLGMRFVLVKAYTDPTWNWVKDLMLNPITWWRRYQE